MREIKFRGKKVDNGQFVNGQLVLTVDGDVYILVEPYSDVCDRGDISYGTIGADQICEVVKETIGQYIGSKDKNDKEIYEGDILKINFAEREFIGIVKWDNTYLGFHPFTKYPLDPDHVEIIGNIYENEDLLEE
ncbi:MAG: hypothetical protein GXO75_08385 [Calditrichaeota bacterium]|nr:hypothetical protein [Calditrichota bacterium]